MGRQREGLYNGRSRGGRRKAARSLSGGLPPVSVTSPLQRPLPWSGLEREAVGNSSAVDRKEATMCLSCGCGKPNDRHGNDANITRQDVEQAARAADISPDQAVENISNGMNAA